MDSASTARPDHAAATGVSQASWSLHVVPRIVGGAASLVFFLPALFASIVVPYRYWDSLAYGSWSRVIEQSGGFVTDGVAGVFLQRPLFYMGQGMLWHWFGFHQAIGRTFSLLFSVILVAALAALAWSLAVSALRDVVGAFAVLLLVACPVFANHVASGMTDVPVAATVTATAALVFSPRWGRMWAVLLALAAAATVLAKPTGLLGLLGIGIALGIAGARGSQLRSRMVSAYVAIGAGAFVGLLYAWLVSHHIRQGVISFLTNGNDAYFRARGAAALHDRLLAADWLGDGVRLPLLFGLALAVARTIGARGRIGTGVAAVVAVGWGALGPVFAHGGAPYPVSSGVPAIAGTVAVLALMTAAVLRPHAEPVPRRVWPAMLAWIIPVALPAVAVRSDEVRFLSPAWAPALIVAAAALGVGAAALADLLRPAAAAAAVAGVGILVIANLTSIDGLGHGGWEDLRALGRSGWSSEAKMENFAYGPFSYQLDFARRYGGANGRIVSSDGRLQFFFPGRVAVTYARSCSDLEGARVFTLLTGGDSKDIMERVQRSTADPLAWIQCASPRLHLAEEQPGEYAAFVVGSPAPALPPAAACRITSYAGQLDDAVFGQGLTYTAAARLAAKAKSVAYPAKVERTGCDTFRVVVTGIPQDAAGQRSFHREAAAAGLDPHFAAAVHYPEVAADVVPPRR